MNLPDWFYYPLAVATLAVILICWILCVREDRREKRERRLEQRPVDEVIHHPPR
jgi:hypothetical protein